MQELTRYSYYKARPTYFDQFICLCASPHHTAAEINKCCDKHHVCVRALKKECPTTTNELHYVYLNTSNYHSDKLLYDVPWTLDLKPSIKHPFPCVGCKDWCKNKKGYTCNYTCE
uniref:Uncharacterized protein n=1 Tax=Meloidogyne incognita TaxID=6306 RepID=A0A914MWS4_MELIC